MKSKQYDVGIICTISEMSMVPIFQKCLLIDGVLLLSPKVMLSREFIEDVKANTNLVNIEDALEPLISKDVSQYTKMTKEEFSICKYQIDVNFIRELKLEQLLN